MRHPAGVERPGWAANLSSRRSTLPCRAQQEFAFEQKSWSLRYKDQMETYDWAWVEARVAQTAEVWRGCRGVGLPEARRYSLKEQQAKEAVYDAELALVEEALRGPSLTTGTRDDAEERIVASFARFSAKALSLDGEAIELLTTRFVPVGTSLARWARRFDPALPMSGIIQAARNAWTACGLQPLLGAPLTLTPSILGYSLMYPYSDNFLDDEEISGEAKLRFSRRFRQRLLGETVEAEDPRERRLWALTSLVETQYPQALYPNVFECFLAIHRAQERSVAQVRGLGTDSDDECLMVSCAKGGTSVLADACLAYGSMTGQESRFAFEWGVLLQLGDDLQDVREDSRHRSMTLFSRAVAEGRPLDEATIQLLKFSDHVGRQMDALAEGTPSFKELLTMSWRSLIVGAVADSHEYFSPEFLRDIERLSPFRFDFLRTRKNRLAGKQGLYAKLFGALLESEKDFDDALPSPLECAHWHHAAATRDPSCYSRQS